MNTTKILEIIIKGIPYPHQIENIEINPMDLDAIRFDWREARYRVSNSLSVEEVEDGVLSGSDRAILLQKILRDVEIKS